MQGTVVVMVTINIAETWGGGEGVCLGREKQNKTAENNRHCIDFFVVCHCTVTISENSQLN